MRKTPPGGASSTSAPVTDVEGLEAVGDEEDAIVDGGGEAEEAVALERRLGPRRGRGSGATRGAAPEVAKK
jgi:hypothetical protein